MWKFSTQGIGKMKFDYIDENLNRIIQNPDNVLLLRQYDVENKQALFAIIKEEEGVYKKIQITKEQSKMDFPWEPLYWFYNGPGYFILKDFMVSSNNMIALNIANLDGFITKNLGENKFFNVGVFATFSDGSATFLWRESAKEFEKNGGIQPHIDVLKKYKEYEPKHDNYEVIEEYRTSDDTFVIPQFQEKKKNQVRVKKIIPDTER